MTSFLPYISICIPAYKRVNYLKRLLDSIELQRYTNFEVVITDDSGADEAIGLFLSTKKYSFDIKYHKNIIPLGSPKNWIEAIGKSSGDWIKIMHDDDCFTGPNSLGEFVKTIKPGLDCIFSGYKLVDDNLREIDKTINQYSFRRIVNNPLTLFAGNIIGPPSVMMFRRGLDEHIDDRLKWIVDWEFYIRLAVKYKLVYIPESLISVGHNETQVTNECFLNPEVEIPETLIFTNKYGNRIFNHIMSYDAWWRLIRNLKIRKMSECINFSKGIPINVNINKMIQFQSCIPSMILRVGLFSKILMTISYTFNREK